MLAHYDRRIAAVPGDPKMRLGLLRSKAQMIRHHNFPPCSVGGIPVSLALLSRWAGVCQG